VKPNHGSDEGLRSWEDVEMDTVLTQIEIHIEALHAIEPPRRREDLIVAQARQSLAWVDAQVQVVADRLRGRTVSGCVKGFIHRVESIQAHLHALPLKFE
jgi:hypothetical protein